MSLPVNALERLFQRLTATYGQEFIGKWHNVSMNDVKAAWSHELAAYANNLNAIGWALENLPDKCPNLIEFKNLCKQAPRPQNEALNAPKADPSVVDAELAKIAQSVFKPSANGNDKVDHKRWAKKLKARHEAEENLSPYQIKMYRETLDEIAMQAMQ